MDTDSLTENEYLNILDETKKYLIHQQKIYGDEIFVDSAFKSSFSGNRESKIQSLDELKIKVQSCRACGLSKQRHKVVLGAGNSKADIMLIGEAPGSAEDLSGRPFVGDAGKLLDKILAAINLKREEIYITNVVKCRPPGNRDPKLEEWSVCRKILDKQIELIKPRFMLILGRVAGNFLLNTNKSLKDMRGQKYPLYGATAIVTYHPAALLRQPNFKRQTWEDVQQFQKLYE